MDRKLVAALTFGIVAVSVANIMLSMGIVSLLLVSDHGTGSQTADAGNAMAFPSSGGNLMSGAVDDAATNASAVMANVTERNTTAAPASSENATPAMTSSAGGSFPSGGGQMPSGQYAPPSGQAPSGSGQYTQGSASGAAQTLPAGQGSPGSGTAQTLPAVQNPSSTGQGLPGNTQSATPSNSNATGIGNYLSGGVPTMKPITLPTSTVSSWVQNNSNMFQGI